MADLEFETRSSSSTSSSSVDVAVQTSNDEDDNFPSNTNKLDHLTDNDDESSVKSGPSPLSSCFTSTGNSSSSTRRNSFQSELSSGLATPLQLLFQSSTSSSNLDSPTSTAPITFSQDSNVLNGLDQLLKRITSERFLELRRIQLGERPVTSGNARSSIENFFDRAINGPTVQQRTEEEAQNRPENVANDVESLLQLSRVTSAIQNGFRSRLEATLHGGTLATSSRNSNQLPAARRRIGNRQQLVQTTRPAVPMHRQQTPRVPPPPPPQPPQHLHILNQQQQQQQQQQHQQSPTILQRSVEASVQLLTESIATDITRLQSLQVVSNLLQDDFRNELENLVQQRVEQSGDGGNRQPPMAVRRAAPDSHQQRGINRRVPPRLHTINEQRASAFANYNNNNNDQINELRREMNEMRQLLRMTMEIQLDTQRSIRQEVSSILSTFMNGFQQQQQPPSAAPQEQSQELAQAMCTIQQNSDASVPLERGKCIICIDQSVDTVFYQCGHMCACHSCAVHLKIDQKPCPMCRAPIRDVIKTYCHAEDE